MVADSYKRRFKRQESWRYLRVPDAWRRPRGVTSRMRKEKKGWPVKVKVGFGNRSASRGLHPRGLREKIIRGESDLKGLDPKVHIARLSSRLGERKRLPLVDKLRQLNIRIANPGKVEAQPVAEEQAAPEKTSSTIQTTELDTTIAKESDSTESQGSSEESES